MSPHNEPALPAEKKEGTMPRKTHTTKAATPTTPTRKRAKGSNGAGKGWKPGARLEFDNGGKERGSGKGGTVKRHGKTTTGYQRGCRCDKCKAAMSKFNKARRAAKRAAAERDAIQSRVLTTQGDQLRGRKSSPKAAA
jgi:hypothetical protein